jgi:hypothetical protein
VTIRDRLLAGEHHGCRTWVEVAAKFGCGKRSLRLVRAELEAEGGVITLGASHEAKPTVMDRASNPGHAPPDFQSSGFDPHDGLNRKTDKHIDISIPADSSGRIPAWIGKSVAEFEATPEPRIVAVEETITRVEEHRLRKRLRDVEAENKRLVEQLSDGGEYAEIVADVMARQAEAPSPSIEPRERTSGLREGTPLILASDWHVEEEVRPVEVAGRNRYNLEIASQRMERFFEASLWAIKHQRDVYKIRDMIAWFGGDFITNFLHDENAQSNLLSPTDAILFWETNVIKGIDYWLTDPEVEQIVIPMNDGNHGRTTKRMQSSTRTQMSLEVLAYAHIATHYRNEPRLKFILPTSQFTFLDDVYGRTIRFLHGDVFQYGGGVGGITVPLMRSLARWESVKHADLTAMGHWHQRICLPNVLVNGSLIGYNAYAMGGGFPFEAPVQSMRMLDASRWIGADIPLNVSDRADDDMARAA